MSDLTELLEGWDDPLGYRNVSEAEDIISMLRAQVKELEAVIERAKISAYEMHNDNVKGDFELVPLARIDLDGIIAALQENNNE